MTRNEPLVSVIIAGYNCKKTIERAVKSVCLQADDNMEVIIVDDGSTDETSTIIRSLQEKYTSVIVDSHKRNQGVSTARNRGIELSRGKYLAFLDADDAWTREFFNDDIKNMLRTEKYDLLRFGVISANKNLTVGKKHYSEDEEIDLNYSEYLEGDIGLFQSYFYHRRVLGDNIRFCPEIKQFEDMTFLYEALFKADNLWMSAKMMYIYRVHISSSSHINSYNGSYVHEQKLADYWVGLLQKYPEREKVCCHKISGFVNNSINRQLFHGEAISRIMEEIKGKGYIIIMQRSDELSHNGRIDRINYICAHPEEAARELHKASRKETIKNIFIYNSFFRGLYYMRFGGELLYKYLY